MSAPTEYLLEMRNISKSFPGVKALDNVTLRVRPGTVHALMGENGAGKSTLMKILFGLYSADSGEVILNGQPMHLESPRQALDAGITMIHQELHPIPFRSVMENIWLGRYPQRKIGPLSFVDHKKMYDDTKRLMDDLQMSIRPEVRTGDLSVSHIQSMEIAKAVSYNAKVIIMDEPTSSLTESEVAHLFRIINRLRSQGVSIIYISHKMEEILKISDDVTIMRDGKYVGTWESKDLNIDLIISRMVGRDLTQRFPDKTNTPAEVLMRVEGLTSPLPRSFKDVSFEVRRGEILGIGGLVGAQRTELVEAIFGLRSVSSGSITVDGERISIHSPIDAKRHKIALLTEERRATGIIPTMSVYDNTIIANLRRYANALGFINYKRAGGDVEENVRRLRVKTPSSRTLIANLSGGNQQKVLLARWLLTEPDVLILDEPTRGIDVGAKYEIYSLIIELAQRGKAVIMISSEMPELLGISDRILVMSTGKVAGVLDREDANQEKIMRLATQFM
ncbi:sugar ABC transporter ATP-binding protein [Chloroflexia bacterium SDU3-3]|nr:sugar ABC transporter ATP-binding protein [Chloroflexia bacterium SDU3-3]